MVAWGVMGATMGYMDYLEKEPQPKPRDRMLLKDFVSGVIHYTARAVGGTLWFKATSEQIHLGMQAAFDELQGRADVESLDLRFRVQPGPDGLYEVLTTELCQLVYDEGVRGDDASFINLIYDAKNPVAQAIHEDDLRVGSPELFTELAETFLRATEKPPEY